MKVLHLIGGELSGGAAKGAYLLHKGLLRLGIESVILTNSRETYNDLNIVSINKSNKEKIIVKIRTKADIFPVLFYTRRKKTLFSTALFGYDFTKHPLYKCADIINLHWINSGFINLKSISKVKKPLFWTMRDMWPMTGGCHYSLDCKRYENGCGYCEQLLSKKEYDLSRYIVRRKENNIPRNINLIGISAWVSKSAKNSYLFRNSKITTIHNNIDCYKEYLPIEKKVARNILNLPSNKKIIITGASSLNSFYKGFNKYLDALKNIPDKSKYFLLFFGSLDGSLINTLGFNYKNYNYLHDVLSLRMVYSAADVFVCSSIMEAFGKTIAESMACGTPVVAFNSTGPKDIIDHKINGYLAIPFDTSELANGIQWVLKDNNRLKQLGQNAREKAIKCFDINIIARKYIDLYEKVLNK